MKAGTKFRMPINLNYSSLFWSIRTLMSSQFIQCVGVWCVQLANGNCLTLENLPLGIVRILIPQTHPLKLIYPFTNLWKLNQTIFPISIYMVPGPRLRPTLYCNHQIEMKIAIWKLGLHHLWTAYLDHGCNRVKNGANVSLILHPKSFHMLFYFPTCAVVVGLCAVMVCWGLASKDWCSGVIAG